MITENEVSLLKIGPILDDPLGGKAYRKPLQMKYQTYVGRKDAPAGGDGYASKKKDFGTPVPVARRFPPVIQLLTRQDPSLQHHLSAAAQESYKQGKPMKQICSDLYHQARALGFEATIGVQEVYSANMPSFPGQTVISALLMVDLRPLWVANREPRSAVGYAS